MSLRRPPRLVALALVVATGIAGLGAGCSKADDTEALPPVGATTPPLTKQAYVQQANAICTTADKKITDLTNSSGPVNNNSGAAATDQLKELVDKIRPIGQNAIDQLKSLTPPPADAVAINTGIVLMQTTLDQSQTNPTGKLDPIGQPQQQLYDYGLTSCYSKPGG